MSIRTHGVTRALAMVLLAGCSAAPPPPREAIVAFAVDATLRRAIAGDPAASCYAFADAAGAIEEWSVDARPSGVWETFDDLDRELLRRVESEGRIVVAAVKAVHRPATEGGPALLVLRLRERSGRAEERRYPLGPDFRFPAADEVVVERIETPGFDWP